MSKKINQHFLGCRATDRPFCNVYVYMSKTLTEEDIAKVSFLDPLYNILEIGDRLEITLIGKDGAPCYFIEYMITGKDEAKKNVIKSRLTGKKLTPRPSNDNVEEGKCHTVENR